MSVYGFLIVPITRPAPLTGCIDWQLAERAWCLKVEAIVGEQLMDGLRPVSWWRHD